MKIFAILIRILDFRGKLIKNRKARVRALSFFRQRFEEKISYNPANKYGIHLIAAESIVCMIKLGGVNFPIALKKSVFRNRKKKIRMRIMLVEDNDIFRETFKEELLGRLPSTIVKEAANGGEAMQKLNGFTAQIIFMDLNLPGENGFQLTQKIKAQFPNVRIALLTSFDLPECRQAAVQYGAERYFVKDSFSWDEIEEFIKGHSA